MELEHGEITGQIIGAAFEVYSILGYCFPVRVQSVFNPWLKRIKVLRGSHCCGCVANQLW
jgi:hypothetical protein